MADAPTNDSAPTPQMAELFMALGKALSAWAVVEQCLGLWFQVMTEIKPLVSNDLFFAPNSFRSRIDMLKTAVQHSTADEALRLFVLEVLNKAGTYADFRNSFVHSTSPTKLDMLHRPRLLPLSGALTLDKYDKGIDATHLEQAAQNFGALASCMTQAHVGQVFKQIAELRGIPVPPIAELLLRVQQLPNDAGSAQPSKKQKGREKQLQAAQGTLPGKRSTGKDR